MSADGKGCDEIYIFLGSSLVEVYCKSDIVRFAQQILCRRPFRPRPPEWVKLFKY